jgi:hypothetical protein
LSGAALPTHIEVGAILRRAEAGEYRWQAVGPPESASSADLTAFLQKRARFDEDSWTVELDIADAERFIAETTSAG